MKSRKSLGCQRHFSLNNSATTTKQPKMVTNKNRYLKKTKIFPFPPKIPIKLFNKVPSNDLIS
jgi:hypothetical protein